MTVPQFLRFYQGYTINSVMDEFAVTFFTLVNAMNRIKAEESLVDIQNNLIPNMKENDAKSTVEQIKKASEGMDKYIEQAKIIRNVRKK